MKQNPNQPSYANPYRSGLKAGLSLPPLMVFVAMLGFGSLAKSQGLDLAVTLLSAGGIYGLPGQVAMIELYATGGSLLAILIGVSMANMRFLPMAISLMPHFSTESHLFRWRYLLIQLMSINSWSFFLQSSPDIPKSARLGFFTGFASICFGLGLIGAALGWQMAAILPTAVTMTLIFLNPAYFIFLFCTNRNNNIILSILIGSVLGPLFFLMSPEWGLPICGLVAGTLGFLISDQLIPKEKPRDDSTNA